MKIIVNGRFLIHRVTGVERYAREILSELDKIIEPESVEMAVPPEVEEIPIYKNITIVKTGKLHNRLWEHISFPWYVHTQKGVSLNLCNVAPLPAPGIVCIHDVKVKATPQYFSKKFLVWYDLLLGNATKRAKKIITVSEFSKSEIVKYFKVNPDKITVIPNAWQHYEKIGYDEDALNKYDLKKNSYYFSMCSLEPNKNFKWIAEEAKRNPDCVFAIAGSINKKVFADGMGFECPDNMKLLGYISDREAKTIMRDCKAFLFPTFYEGFGIPPLEAMSAGTKNIYVSDTAVMHEVFGDSVSYINPYKYDRKLVDNNEEKTESINRVLGQYSWKKSAELLYDGIRTIK
ncbi:MAG: glycosyltransferase family 4 protein [Faecalibacterium prausnitzii]|nr:glycosyltransferase family 4 protein [Faecalibacterium prausnitzii]